MSASSSVGRSANAAWVTRAEAAFLARVPVEEIDRELATGRLVHRRIGATVFVDLRPVALPVPAGRSRARIEGRVTQIQPPVSPVQAGSVRGARARSDPAPAGGVRGRRRRRMLRHRIPGPAIVIGAVGITCVVLIALQVAFDARPHRLATSKAAPHRVATATPSPTSIPVGRDPFASAFGAPREGDERGAVLVKPPGVVREGERLTAATTVVNRSSDRWLPPSQVIFVARDETGHAIAEAATTVSLGPGRAQVVIAPDLGLDATAIAAIEAHIDAAPLRSGRYPGPSVRVVRATVTEGARAIEGVLHVGAGARAAARLSCIVVDSLDEPSAFSSSSVDLARVRRGRLRFWLTTRPTTPGPYRVSCSAA